MVAFQRYLVEETEQIKQRIACFEKLLMAINCKLDVLLKDTVGSGKSADLPDSVHFPLRCMSEVEQLEVQLEDVQIRDAIVSCCAFIFLVSL